MKVIECASGEAPACDTPRTVNSVRPPQQNLQFPNLFRLPVVRGSTLFRSGEPRRLYLVETGALCHYTQSADGHYDIIEFVFPGETIGLGCLAAHVSTAKAMADTYVRVITNADLERAIAHDDRLFFRIAEAHEREFEYLQNSALKAQLRPPIERVANFLLALAGINASEGGDPLVVTGDVSSGYVADQLQMSIDTLAKALLRLRQSGSIDVSDHGLRILDIAALETMAANAVDHCPRELVRQLTC
jgi:CRP/FNR family transcriptional regulator